jgi:excisionase family DNA binding protein
LEEYLTTREVARYLRLNEKKVYDLVARGKLPAARISGKWLFPRRLIDGWVESNTIHPAHGLMTAVLEQMVVIQGSDDWLLGRVIERDLAAGPMPVVSANVGSMAGLRAIADGKAHLAGCHVDNDSVRRTACRDRGCYLLNLFERHQGLIHDPLRHPGLKGLGDVVTGRLRFAERQPLSGTFRLVERLLDEQGLSLEGLDRVGPFSEHMSLALAIRTGQADAGVGIRVAADQCGLGFIPLHTESYKLAIPAGFFSSPGIARFMEVVLAGIEAESRHGVPGYGFANLGRIETVTSLRGDEKGDQE